MSTDRTESTQMQKSAELLRTLGYIETLEMDRDQGRATVVFEAGRQHVNDDNVVQGGIVTGWLDVAMASAVFAAGGSRARLATLEIKTTFLRPVSRGQRLRVEGWILRLGRTTAFLAGQVLDDADTVLATASSTAAVTIPGRVKPAPEPGG